MTETLDLLVAALAHGGAGVAHVERDGERRAVFLARTAPGDEVRARVDFDARPARGTVLEILRPSEARTPPPCADAERCGACDWMHLAHSSRVAAHEALVREVLPGESYALTFHSAPRETGWRIRARLHARPPARARRGGALAIGFHGTGTHEPVDVASCIVLHPALESARRKLALVLEGVASRGEIRLALGAAHKPVADLRFERDLPPSVYARTDALVTSGEWAGARVFGGGVTRPSVMGRPEPIVDGADGSPLVLPPGGFSQANAELNGELARLVDASIPRGTRVLELHAGAGNLSVLLARDRRLVAVEAEADAVEAARKNLRTRALDAKVVHGDAETQRIESGVQAVVLDPPRTGARGLADTLAKAPRSVRTVAYVSCDAPTLGRDLARIGGRFRLREVHLFEMFPQTSHVEIVAVLEAAS